MSDDEKMFTTRPDASMNIACGASLGKRIGCGEVKPQYQALNHQAIAKDLIRVGHLLKDASDKNQTKMTLGFVVVGKFVHAFRNGNIVTIYLILFFIIGIHGTFYILSRAQEYLYLMCEIEHIQLPIVLAEIPLFLAQLDKVMNIVASFAQVARQEHHNYDRHPLTLTDHKLFAIIDPKTSRKRKSITSHYTH